MGKLPSSPVAEIIIRLVGCPHTAIFRRAHLPKVGERIWCRHCEEYRPVAEHVGMYRSRCAWRGCKFARSYGSAKRLADRSAAQHAREHPGHAVAVYLGTERVSLHGIDPSQLELPELLE